MAAPNVGDAVEQTVLQNVANKNKISSTFPPSPASELDVDSDFHGSAKVNGTKTPAATEPYKVLEEPNRVGRKIKVITIGAGASALNFAHDIDTNPLDIDLVMYEKNPEIGGTWFENRYPGCACDIPSVVYQLSWAPSAEWGS